MAWHRPFIHLLPFAPNPPPPNTPPSPLPLRKIDNPERGFTYKWEGPLDLRMNPSRGQPAWQLLAKWAKQGPARLEAMLVANADEEHAARIAKAVCAAVGRGAAPETTTALAAVVRAALGDLKCASLSQALTHTRTILPPQPVLDCRLFSCIRIDSGAHARFVILISVLRN